MADSIQRNMWISECLLTQKYTQGFLQHLDDDSSKTRVLEQLVKQQADMAQKQADMMQQQTQTISLLRALLAGAWHGLFTRPYMKRLCVRHDAFMRAT